MDSEKQGTENLGALYGSSSVWSASRCRQLRQLELLVHHISMADKGSSFIRSFQDAEKIAAELSESRFPGRSFLQFLNDIAAESRQRHKELTGSLPE